MVTEKMNDHEIKRPTAEHSRPPSQPIQTILLIQQIQAALRGAIFHEFR